MDAKGADASRASSGKTEAPWWRWSHGKSGSISSSSDGVSSSAAVSFSSAVAPGATAGSGSGGVYGEAFSPSVASKHGSSSNNHSFSCSSVTHSVTPTEKVRWQSRNTRGGGLPAALREEQGSSTFSARDSWIPALSLGVAPSGTSSAAPKLFAPSPRSLSRRSSAPKKKSVTSQGSSRASAYARPAPRQTSSFAVSSAAYADISWSAGNTAKRKVSKKEKKSGRSTVAAQSSYRASASRPPVDSYDANQDEEMYSSAFALKASWKSPIGANPNTGNERSRSTSSPLLQTSKNPFTKVATAPLSSTSTASSSSSSSSIGVPGFSSSRSDPVVDCARAVLQDCIRQRHKELNNARKRAIDVYDGLESKRNPWQYATVSKKTDWSMMSSGSSSGSDEELSQLSSRDHFMCDDKCDRNSGESKLSSEEYLRQAMLQGCALSSSPELECFSPLYEEKGLSVEIRYQLPIALGTADETDKQCTICQIRYGIGDHIVTLPCQHFFHACCVDKWLWNHTSCPLCRTEVSLESDVETSLVKTHKFSECSETDQNRLRRQLRSTSHTAGFKPVIPVEEEIAELESSITTMNIDDEEISGDEGNAYLVCPTPQRPRAD